MLDPYRLVDPKTLDVVGNGRPEAWTHVTSLVEEASTVTVSVNVLTFAPGPEIAPTHGANVRTPRCGPARTKDLERRAA